MSARSSEERVALSTPVGVEWDGRPARLPARRDPRAESGPSHSEAPAPAVPARRDVAELMQVVEAYNAVTERLERSHATLTAEVRRLEGRLASANAALLRSRRLAALGEMAAGIAHEVRNPLASIQLYARLLQQDLADRPEQGELAGRIAEAVHGLDAVVGDVLSFSREVKPRLVPGEPRPVLERAVDALRPMIEAAAIGVVFEIAEPQPEVPHDPELLHRALLNLIRNAVQAMEGARGRGADADQPPGAQSGERRRHRLGEQKRLCGAISLGALRDGDVVRLTVRDTGPGISDEAVDRIFNPFFTTRATGTGLGLAIVHRIVDAHGGSIAVHNGPAGGAVFTLTLPTRAAGGGTADGPDRGRDATSLGRAS